MEYKYVGESFGSESATYASLAGFIEAVDRLDEPEYSAAARRVEMRSDGNYYLDDEMVLQCIPQ